MRDQATSLRELRANFDKIVTKQKAESTQDFLGKIKRESPLSAHILIYPDSLQASYPDIEGWLPQLSKNTKNIYLWDQANLIQKRILTQKNQDELPFPVMPKQVEMLDMTGKTDAECFTFLKNISQALDKQREVWITVNSRDLPYYSYLLKAANSLYIMLPEHNDSIIKGYEIVKNIFGLNLNSSIYLLEFSLKPFLTESNITTRIKNVAKQFLGIDLSNAGVVLSTNRYIPPINEGEFSGHKTTEDSSNSDFMYAFSENIVNLRLGTH
jgi:hypothetical protein